MSTGVIFRELDMSNKSEVGFVYKSWIGSYKNHADVTPFAIYRRVYQAYLDRILKRAGSVVTLAVNPDYPDQILGFTAAERGSTALHYIYVKQDFRKTGVGTDLIENFIGSDTSGEFNYTFNTALGRKFLKKRGGRYKPSIVRNELCE